MKKIIMIILLTVFFVNPAQARNSCLSMMCLAGAYQGKGVVEGCRGAIIDYFNIYVTDPMTLRYDWPKTFRSRDRYLNSCGDTDGWAKKLNLRYGYQTAL